MGEPHSTIGAGGLNGRVRDGNGCITSAIATGKRFGRHKCPLASLYSVHSLQRTGLARLRSRPFAGLASGTFLIGLKIVRDRVLRQSVFLCPCLFALSVKLNTEKVSREVAMVNMVKPHGPLVPVSFNHYWSFTSGLLTSWSRRGL